MVLPLAVMSALAQQCAPSVAPSTLLSIAAVESGLDPLAIGVNRPSPARLHPHTAAQAVATATRLIANGANIDLGVAQINSKNLGWLGLTVADAFDPCANLAASAKVIATAYGRAANGADGPQAALRRVLSYYNTGDAQRGFRNGYVAKVLAASGQVVPALAVGGDAAPDPVSDARPKSEAPPWDVFARARPATSFVLSPLPPGDEH